MYINLTYAQTKNLSNNHVLCLIMTHQNSNGSHEEFLKTIPDQVFVDLNDEGYFTVIKGKKGQSKRNRLRLSKKGKGIIVMLSTPDVTDGDKAVMDFLKNVYRTLDKTIASDNKLLKLISNFRVHSSLSEGELYQLCKKFVNDESQMNWTQKLEYIFHKPQNVYEKFNISNSKLYLFYLEHGYD